MKTIPKLEQIVMVGISKSDLHDSSPVNAATYVRFQGCLVVTRINDNFLDQIQSRPA